MTDAASTTDVDPFSLATEVRELGDGTYAAELAPDWSVADHPHGGYLLALPARAAARAGTVVDEDRGVRVPDPLAVSAQFLRAPRSGPALLRTEVRKSGRTVTVVRVVLEQSGSECLEATVTLGAVPDGDVLLAELPDMSVNPPAEAVDLSARSGTGDAPGSSLAGVCDMRLDPSTAGFLRGDTTAPPRLRLWVRPRSAPPDVLFALLAGDLTMPITFNLGRFSWAPTVQLTALVRGRPANGWLRLDVASRTVDGQWFDEDVTVLDSTGRLVCQARQLALTPA